MSTAETLKKVGFPATVAAVIATAVTLVPFLFKVDERYAKSSQVEAIVSENEERLAILTAEVGKLTGVTEVLVAVIGQQRTQLEMMAAANNLVTRTVQVFPPVTKVTSVLDIDRNGRAFDDLAPLPTPPAPPASAPSVLAPSAAKPLVPALVQEVGEMEALDRASEVLRGSQEVLKTIQE